MKTLGMYVATNGVIPANKKFNVLIRLLDERNSEGEKNRFMLCQNLLEVAEIVGRIMKICFIVTKHFLGQKLFRGLGYLLLYNIWHTNWQCHLA
jgi:hypothetical protein